MKILFVQTGGTIDKDYPKTTNGLGFEIGEPAFRRLLEERLIPSFQYEFHSVCQKDSTEIRDDDRSAMRQEINHRLEKALQSRNPFDGVILTHGTDTMAETARYLAKPNESSPVKAPIILTGAMRPERFSNSDADCNLGMAIAAVQTAPPGFVGICMHGLVLTHERVGRDLQTGKFIPKIAETNTK